MRIGGGIERPYADPDEWAALVSELGYRAVLSPVDCTASAEERKAYAACAREHDLVIGEVGVWRNALSENDSERTEALEYSMNQLALADELGANCCVNISGSRGEVWDGCCAGKLDFGKVARLCEGLGPDMTLFVEHLPDFESYKRAAAYVRGQARLAGVRV